MSRLINAAKRLINNPRMAIRYLNTMGFLNFLSDRACCKLQWWAETGSRLNLDHPTGFNEKLQWLKVYDHRPEYTLYVDKVLVRDYVKTVIGEKYLVPLIGVYDNPDQIDFDLLPDKFVIKCNHNSGGGMCVCSDKASLDIQSTKNKLKKELKKNFYYENREWPYKNIVPKLMCEEYIIDKSPKNTSGTLIDYKFYCFNGEPKFLYVGTDDISNGTKGELNLSFFDFDWNLSPFYRSDHKPLQIDVEKPECLDEMIEISGKLSKGFPFVRVDLYWVNNQILFSELTFFPGGGYGLFNPEEWENRIGSWITLPEKTC